MTIEVPDRTHGHDAPLEGPDPVLERFVTPRGRQVSMFVRPDTTDHNTLYSCLNEDEYGLRDVELGDGTAIDIGAHIGGATVALAVDNPNATIVAVEALSENVTLLERNLEANGITNVSVFHAIAGRPGKRGRKGTVNWNFGGGESAQGHRFIANAVRLDIESADSEQAIIIALNDLPEAAFMKIDCEGGEYELLRGDTSRIAEIRGEFHAGFEELVALLDTHHVYMTSGIESFGGFRAVRK